MKKYNLLFVFTVTAICLTQPVHGQIPASKKKCSSPPGIPRLKIKVIKNDSGDDYTYILRFSARNAKRYMVGLKDSNYQRYVTSSWEGQIPSWDLVYLPWGVQEWVGKHMRPDGPELVQVKALNACGASESPTFYVYKDKIQKKGNNSIRRSGYVNIGPFPEGVDSVVFRHYKQKKNGAKGRH